MNNHPLDLRGWWHRSHIPARGEEERGGCLRRPEATAVVINTPNLKEVGFLATRRRSFDESTYMWRVAVSSE